MMLKCRKRRLRETKFEKFYGGHAPRPPGLEACAFSTCISSLEANKNPPFFPQKGLECLDSEHPPLLQVLVVTEEIEKAKEPGNQNHLRFGLLYEARI